MTASFLLPRPSGLVTTLCVFACGLFTAQAAESLPNLDEEKPNPRFAVTDRVWPSKPGEAHICLWKDDTLAALSLTIDDNCGPDVPWWLEMAEKHSLPLTWFLITERIGKGNRFNLTWPDWVAVGEKGHALESHTAMHFHTDREGWDGVEWEYTQAIKDIEENVPGHRVHFLAYVGGKNSHLNSRELAAKYYAAARGTTGRINPPNATDYLNVSAMSNPNLGDGAAWSDLNGMFDPTHRGYRGWAVIIYHLVQDRETLTSYFEFIEKHRPNLWVGTFGDVARYGQERDTATLEVVRNDATAIEFELTDRMKDEIFDYPLTVKVRLPDSWQGVQATQGNAERRASMVEHEGARFALVDAVPDRGRVVLQPSS